MAICGESGEVRGETVESWKERLPEILRGYQPEDIWNMDETGCFWKALPDKGFGEKGKSCKGGKKSKQRFTVAFFVNAAGGKELKPIVIWKSANPRCFKGLDKSQLPVQYFSQKKSWMSGEIMNQILEKLNAKLKVQARSIVLLMDNAGCHPEDLQGKYSNIKVIFMPPNTTSVLQPLDLGIIKNFKVYYRKLLLQHIISQIDECESAYELVKSVDVLIAIRWVARACESVAASTIQKCFRKCGVLQAELTNVVSRGGEEEDPFADLETEHRLRAELQEMIGQVDTRDGMTCSAEEFITADDALPICRELEEETWSTDFLEEIGPRSQVEKDDEDEDDDEDEEDEQDPVQVILRITSFREAVQNLADVAAFLDTKCFTAEANKVSEVRDMVAAISCKNTTRQASILDYFH